MKKTDQRVIIPLLAEAKRKPHLAAECLSCCELGLQVPPGKGAQRLLATRATPSQCSGPGGVETQLLARNTTVLRDLGSHG